MRILFFTHYFPPEGNAPASRTHELCKRWVADGHQVTVVTGAPNVPDGVVYEGYRNRLRQREVLDGIDVVRVWTYIAPNKGTARRIANYVSYMISAAMMALFLPRPDICVATSPQFFCGWAGTLYSTLRRVPFLLEIRDIWPDTIETVGAMSHPKVLGFIGWLAKRMYDSADHIVTVGEGYRGELVKHGVAPERISIVTNGADLDFFTPQPADPELMASFGLRDRFVLSFVGTIGMCSGLDVMLRAARLLKEKGRDDIGFLLVGDGAVRQELETAARAQGLDNLAFAGRQPKERIPAFIAASGACLAHLQKAELFTTVLPSKIFEAAAMERPIVLGVTGQAAALVERAGAGLCIEPENEQELVAAVERLAGDPELCRRFAVSGREHIQKHYDRDVLARDYLAILQRFARGSAARDARSTREPTTGSSSRS
jgi:hypothetical protein